MKEGCQDSRLEILVARVQLTKAYRPGVQEAVSGARNVLENAEGYKVTKVVVENEPTHLMGRIAYLFKFKAINAVVTFFVQYKADTEEHRMEAQYTVFCKLIDFLNILPMLSGYRESYYRSAELLRGKLL